MSGTLYTVLAEPRADHDTIRRIFAAKENHVGNDCIDPVKVLDDITRNHGWRPALDEPTLDGDSVWGFRQRDVLEYVMPDGKKYYALVSWILDWDNWCDTDIPDVRLYSRVDDIDGFTLLGYEPEGDTLVITYGEEKDVYQFMGYTIGITTVASVDPKDEFCLSGKVPYIDRLYLESFIGKDSPFKAVEFRKAVAVPNECFQESQSE